jgi:hypothetical protein
MGRGKAKFYLNNIKVVEVRNALHVPGLQAPLYSLCQHRHMEGCGYYSQFGVGSFVLFPTFTIQVDDSEDNIVSFKAIGALSNIPTDYTEPKYPSACPVHVIPVENEMASVQFCSIVPKAGTQTPPPAKTPPTPEVVPDPDSTFTITNEELTRSAEKPLTKRMVKAIHENVQSIPDVPPSYTPAPAEHTTSFDSLRLHRIFGCRKFKNQLHITAASKNASLICCGELPTTIGNYTTINNPPKGKPIKKRQKYLDKVHLDIVYGDCMGLGGIDMRISSG